MRKRQRREESERERRCAERYEKLCKNISRPPLEIKKRKDDRRQKKTNRSKNEVSMKKNIF